MSEINLTKFGMVETVVTALEDEFNVHIKKYLKKREFLVLIVCVILFFLALPNICPVICVFVVKKLDEPS
jgi:hypothetical protein